MCNKNQFSNYLGTYVAIIIICEIIIHIETKSLPGFKVEIPLYCETIMEIGNHSGQLPRTQQSEPIQKSSFKTNPTGNQGPWTSLFSVTHSSLCQRGSLIYKYVSPSILRIIVTHLQAFKTSLGTKLLSSVLALLLQVGQ